MAKSPHLFALQSSVLINNTQPHPAMTGTGAQSRYQPGRFDGFGAGSGNSQTDPEAVVPSLAIQLRINIRIHRPHA